jgi:polyphenol oxidase
VTLSLRSPLLSSHGFRHGFSLRDGGASTGPYARFNLGRSVGDDPRAVEHNQRLLAQDVGYPPDRLYEVDQVHGGVVARVDPALGPEVFRTREADALVSSGAGQALGIRVADCAPVLIADPESGAVAAVHAGWRGVVADIIPAAVRQLCAEGGGRPVRFVAALFPCIGVGAFEVGGEVATHLAERVSERCVVREADERPHVDLALAVHLQLEQAGLIDSHIERVPGCTFSEPARFFSHRRDRGVTGRHLAVIVSRC